ncbi:MAG: serine hydrolase [Gemmatimonadales bacterium]|nr:serine hydrolase [Gemmatimonadales bacterium]
MRDRARVRHGARSVLPDEAVPAASDEQHAGLSARGRRRPAHHRVCVDRQRARTRTRGGQGAGRLSHRTAPELRRRRRPRLDGVRLRPLSPDDAQRRHAQRGARAQPEHRLADDNRTCGCALRQNDSEDGTGRGFGLGFSVVKSRGLADAFPSVGTFRCGGAYGTSYWADPEQGIVGIYMMQLLPARTDVGGKLPALVYQAITGPGAPVRRR